MKKAIICSLIAAFVLALPADAAGPGKPIASASDTGEYFVSASLSREVKRVRKMWAVVAIDPPATVDLDYTVSCERGYDFDHESGSKNVADGAVYKLPRPLRKPKSCSVDLSANHENFEADNPPETTVRVELRATRYPKR